MRYLNLLFLLSLAQSAVLEREVRFGSSRLEFRRSGDYDLVLGADMDVSDEPGAPQLPVQPVVVSLPGCCRVNRVTFEPTGWQPLAASYRVYPAQRQSVLSQGSGFGGRGPGAVAATHPDPAIYQSSSPWPAAVARWTGTSYSHDSTFVQTLVYPVRYTGASGRLEVCSRVNIGVEYEPGAAQNSLADSAFEYVIITGGGLDTVFQRLADWKTQKGAPAVVRTIGWITSNYPGRDGAERLRNYLKTVPDSGAKYVLLGGDIAVVPYRTAYAMSCEWGARPRREDSLPCDFYFADLDGSWDANDNGVFGEVDDSVDLHAELSVGRAPVNNVEQAQTFVRKVLDYERGAVAGFQDKGLFFAEILWQDPYTDQGVHKNRVEQQSFAAGYDIAKLYQSLGNETRESVMEGIRQGRNFLNHDGHGWIDVMSCGGGSGNRMRTADADTITNSACGVLYSIGCWTAAFDSNSIAEAFVTNRHGGTVATIGNSSYGWGSPGNPGFGYSDKFDNRFWHAITSEGKYRVGEALTAAKSYYAPFSRDKNVYRWHQYELNLMGDPEMPIWTALPESLTVVAPLSVGIGPGRYLFSVAGSAGPVAWAKVCLSRAGDVYSRGLTDDAGRVWLDADPAAPGWLNLTVTAHNFLPFTGAVACDSGNYANFAGWSVDDRTGNFDGIANPGETVGLPFVLCNTGTEPTGAATVRLRNSDPRVVLLDSFASVPGVGPGDSVRVDSGLRVSVEVGPYDGAAIQFRLDITGGCLVRTFFPVLQIGEPMFVLDRTWLGQLLLPGTNRGLGARVENIGHGYGHSTWCRLVSLDSFVTIATDSVWYGEVGPLSYGTSSDSFVVSASGSCPSGHVALMELQVNADGLAGFDTFELLVGEHGFSDDMETGETKWSHGGAGDLWHLTSYRAHSGANSWYCGDEGTRLYNSNMDAWLLTEPFVVTDGCTLRFWRWFKVPNYGVDGIRVVVVRAASEETLDFVGTGGALRKTGTVPRVLALRGTVPVFHAPRVQALFSSTESSASPLVNQSDWAEEKYDLSWLGLGETVRVKLAFASDRDTVDEGFYIDDVRVVGGSPPVIGVAELELPSVRLLALSARPNPFRKGVTVQLAMPLREDVRGRVFDASGRMVRGFLVPAGHSGWRWDGLDARGTRLPAGAYFVEARTGAATSTVRLLMVD